MIRYRWPRTSMPRTAKASKRGATTCRRHKWLAGWLKTMGYEAKIKQFFMQFSYNTDAVPHHLVARISPIAGLTCESCSQCPCCACCGHQVVQLLTAALVQLSTAAVAGIQQVTQLLQLVTSWCTRLQAGSRDHKELCIACMQHCWQP